MSAKWNNTKPGNKTWVHSAAALTAGHVVYNIKYLGNVEVTSPKGADVVKEAVTKLKFNKQVKRSEGTKPPKRELTISVDGIVIQERQSKEKQFTYPLHHISYCADDKSDKKICAFIAKDSKENKHICHVMESDKNAEEITLTVGQAFDLAYQKFLSNANRSQEQEKQNETLQQRVEELEEENKKLKQRITELELQQGLPVTYPVQTNGEQEKPIVNPFNRVPEPSHIAAEPQQTDTSRFSFSDTSAPPDTTDTPAAVNLLADLQATPQAPQRQSQTLGTLAAQAAAYEASKQSEAFEDTFKPPPKKVEPILLPPPPVPARHVEPPPPPVSQSPVVPPSPTVPQSPTLPQSPQSPTVNGAPSSTASAIARPRSRPRPHGHAQGSAGGIAPPPRTVRRGDSFGPLSPPPVSPSSNVAPLASDDLYATVNKPSAVNGGGTGTSNPFQAPSADIGFGNNLDFLSNKGSLNATTTGSSSSSGSAAFTLLDLDPLK